MPEIKRDFSGEKNRKNMRVEENKYEMQNKALQYVTNKSKALLNKKELQVLDIISMIELANLKFGYKVQHNLLPPITTNLCMLDSKNQELTKQHKYSTRYKRTPYLPKNATQQYKSSFLCKGPQSLLTLNVETIMKPNLHSFVKHCKGLLLNKM